MLFNVLKADIASFRASPRSIKPIYTGGPVVLTKDGRWLITTLGEEVAITEVETGLPVARIRGVSPWVFDKPWYGKLIRRTLQR